MRAVFRMPVLAVGLLLGCKTSAGGSRVMQDQGQFTESNSVWQWVQVPFADQRDYSLAIDTNSASASDVVDPTSSNPALARMQFWIDAIDNAVRTAHPDQLAPVPHPKALLINTDTEDMFASSIPVCYDVPVIMQQGGANGPAVASVILTANQTTLPRDPRDAVTGDFNPVKSLKSGDCVHKALADADIEPFVAWLNGAYSTCKVQATTSGGHGAIALNGSCSTDQAGHALLQTTGTAKSLMVSAMSDWITVYAGMMKEATEEHQLIFALAHELGHYYRAHLVAPATSYEYFYAHGQNPSGAKPPMLAPADAQAAGQLVSKAYAAYTALDGDISVPGQLIQTPLFDPLVQLLTFALKPQGSACPAGSSCQSACAPAQSLAADPSFQASDGSGYFGTKFPHEALAGAALQQYQQFESALMTCAAAVPVATSTTAGIAGGDLVTLNGPMANILNQLPAGVATLADVIGVWNKTVQGLESSMSDGFATMASEDLGYYTYEQEADEIALEELSLIGLDPHVGIDFLLVDGVNLEQSDGAPHSPLVNAADCTKLYHATPPWQGAPYIHFGPTSDPHHIACYRAKNAFDQIAMHGYQVAGTAPTPPGPPWSSLTSALP